MWISRSYEPTVQSLIRQFPAVVLTGARQVGKTSLVRRVFPGFSYVSLDIPAKAAQAEQSPDSFLRKFGDPVIIDEVQYAPSLFRHLKAVIDQDKRPGRFILTGSQNFPLMQGVSESLAGRCGLLHMLNLSVAELAKAPVETDESDFIFKGGFPELYAGPKLESHFWYASYLSTYLERDVRNILNIGSLRDFDRFLRAVAVRTGQTLSYSSLARDVGIAPNTAKKWISVLQASGQIYLLEPYYKNLGKRLVKAPKLYMCDTGLAIFLMGFDSWESVARHSVIGAIWETHVIMQTVKYFQSLGKNIPLWYWRTAYGDEVDLLIEQGGQFIAVEIKYSEQPDQSCLKGIQALKKMYGDDSLTSAYVACRTIESYPLGDLASTIPGSRVDSYL